MTEARLGFIGCGTHSTNNLYPMLKYARCRLQAVCDLDLALAERNARIFGAAGAAYADVRAMLDREPLDGVIVVGPPDMHYAVGKQVLERGIPLMVEKPPAGSLQDAEELLRIAEAQGTTVMVGFMKRFALTYGKIHEEIRAGRFVPSCGFFRYTHWAGMDLTSMLLGMSIHPIDLAISYFGDPVEVTAVPHRASGALSLALIITHAGGQWSEFMLGCHGPRIQEHVELSGMIDGKHGYYLVDDIIHLEEHTAGQGGVDVLAPTLPEIAPQFDLQDIRMWRPDFGIPNMGQNSPFLTGYAGEIREFVDAILDHRQPRTGGEEGLKAMRVIDVLLRNPDGGTFGVISK